MHFKLVYDITPVPKQSFRAANGHGYQTKTIKENKLAIQLLTKQQIKELRLDEHIKANFTKPLDILIKCIYPPTKSNAKYAKEASKQDWIFPKSTKPDVDNLTKQILDSFQGILYKNDSQVYRLNIDKYYDFIDKPIIKVYIEYFRREQ